MRVLKVIASSARGGAEENFLALSRELTRAGIDVTIACDGEGPMLDAYRAVAREAIPITLSYPTHLGSIAQLRALIRRVRPDVTHTHLWNADLLAGIAASRERVPLVTTVTGPYFLPIHPRSLVRWRRRMYSTGFRSVYRLCDTVIACSQELARDLETRPGLNVPASRIRVVYNGLDLERLDRRAEEHSVPAELAERPAKRLTMVANFYPIKGQQTLVRALPAVFAEHPDLQVAFVGDGPDFARISREVRATPYGNRVVFTGMLANAVSVMRDSDIVTLPSNGEGLPMVLLEAMALGRPVVATRVGGIPELVDDAHTGMLVPPDNPGALARTLIDLLNHPDRRQRLGDAARGEVRARWSATATAARVRDIYHEVLERRQRGQPVIDVHAR